ncbi:ABC transporter permease [Prevotella sp.]|nr:ABC transporter permease [uncultured Prevotella sp.]
MADNFLERQRRDYEQRKLQWQRNNTKKTVSVAEILKKSRQRFNND